MATEITCTTSSSNTFLLLRAWWEYNKWVEGNKTEVNLYQQSLEIGNSFRWNGSILSFNRPWSRCVKKHNCEQFDNWFCWMKPSGSCINPQDLQVGLRDFALRVKSLFCWDQVFITVGHINSSWFRTVIFFFATKSLLGVRGFRL